MAEHLLLKECAVKKLTLVTFAIVLNSIPAFARRESDTKGMNPSEAIFITSDCEKNAPKKLREDRPDPCAVTQPKNVWANPPRSRQL